MSGMSEIPPTFHSFEHDGPFEECLACNKRLDQIDDPYVIAKVFRGPECVLEYAICHPCRENVAKTFSEQSQQTMADFFEKRHHFFDRLERLDGNQNHKDWLTECASCQTPATEIDNYSIASMAFGSHLVFGPFPLLICEQCDRLLHKNLSKSTKDQWDKFILDHFDGPPADALKPDGVPMLV